MWIPVAVALIASLDVAVVDGARPPAGGGALWEAVRAGAIDAGAQVLPATDVGAAIDDAAALGVRCALDDGTCWIRVGKSTEIAAFLLVEQKGDQAILQAVDVRRGVVTVRSLPSVDDGPAARALTAELCRAAFPALAATVPEPPVADPAPDPAPPVVDVPVSAPPEPSQPPPVVDAPGLSPLAWTGIAMGGAGLAAAVAAGIGAGFLDAGLTADLQAADDRTRPLPDDFPLRRTAWATLAIGAVIGAGAAVAGAALFGIAGGS